MPNFGFWILIFNTDQAQINSVKKISKVEGSPSFKNNVNVILLLDVSFLILTFEIHDPLPLPPHAPLE
jgi:hypothetical protein